MKESDMENEKTALYVAFSTQKGGTEEDYKCMVYKQFTRPGKKIYLMLRNLPEKAVVTADEYVTTAGHVPDIVFFDLPGTVNSGTL